MNTHNFKYGSLEYQFYGHGCIGGDFDYGHEEIDDNIYLDINETSMTPKNNFQMKKGKVSFIERNVWQKLPFEAQQAIVNANRKDKPNDTRNANKHKVFWDIPYKVTEDDWDQFDDAHQECKDDNTALLVHITKQEPKSIGDLGKLSSRTLTKSNPQNEEP